MSIVHVTGEGLPAPVGPYSTATIGGGFIFVSGQAGRDPQGHLAADIEGQTRQTLRNLETILQKAGSSLAKVLHTRVYLSDIRNFDRMNAVYREVFGGPFPARTTVEVSALPEVGLLVEIDVIALQA